MSQSSTSTTPAWLPPLVLFQDDGGNWNKYLKRLYNYFKQNFIDSKPTFQGVALGVKRHPIEQGKEATFWHIISEGKVEDDRLPDFRRCERIRWPRPIIEHSTEPVIKVWENKRGRNETRICLWLEQQEYLVVLAKRKNYVLLWTAYPVTQPHSKRKLEKEYQAYLKAKAAP